MLWRFGGKRWIDVTEAHHNSATGLDAYLVCPGPSLADVDTDALVGPGRLVVAINTAYPRVRPDVWCAMDRPACFDPGIWRESITKIVNGARRDEAIEDGLTIKDAPGALLADAGRAHVSGLWHPQNRFIANKNTFVFALSVLAHLGCPRIHLVGCDLGGKRDYHDDRVLRDAQRATNRELYAKLAGLLPIVRDAADQAGVELVSCTPRSAANDHLPFVSLTGALAASASRGATRGPAAPLIHARDAEACRWSTEPPCAVRGIVVGADDKQAWMLPWFVDNLRRSGCRLPLAIADFGLGADWLRWAREHALVFDPTGPADLHGWHLKPFALLRSPWRDSLWLDLDCQVLRDPAEIVDAGVPFGLTRDPHAKLSRPNGWATGVVMVRRGEPVVEAWARSVVTGNHRGDQEALDAIRDSVEPRIVELPRRYQRLRLDGPAQEGDVIYHWTGPVGKRAVPYRVRDWPRERQPNPPAGGSP